MTIAAPLSRLIRQQLLDKRIPQCLRIGLAADVPRELFWVAAPKDSVDSRVDGSCGVVLAKVSQHECCSFDGAWRG